MKPIVLIVDDDCDTTATPLEIALGALDNVEVVMLTNVRDAITILSNSAFHVKAVVTDLHLPLMNGFELIEHIRRDVRYANLPIVVITGDSDPLTRICALEKGADAYFPKPYSPTDLRHELERLLHANNHAS